MTWGKQKEMCRLPGTSLAFADKSFQELWRTPKQLGNFGEDQAACRDLQHHKTKNSGIIFPEIERSSPYKKFRDHFIMGKLRYKQYFPERSAARQAVRHSKTWQKGWYSLKKLNGIDKPDRAGNIVKLADTSETPLKTSEILKKRNGLSIMEQIPQVNVHIRHVWGTSASKYPRCRDTPFKTKK